MPLPTNPPFDIYCAAPTPPDILNLFTHVEAVSIGDGGQLSTDATNNRLIIQSGGGLSSVRHSIYINASVPATYTTEFQVMFQALPVNFNDLQREHLLLSASDSGGSTFALFFSYVGIAYTGYAYYDNAGDLVLASALQALPKSDSLIEEGVEYTIRVATDANLGVTYIYITPTADIASIGQQLRYVLPAFFTTGLQVSLTDQTFLSVKGSNSRPSTLALYNVQMGNGLIVPDVLPRADAGADQAIRTCAIAQLDGSASFDHQGSPITYLWQLVDVPLGSAFAFDGNDGQTYPLTPTPTGFTSKFHSAELGAEHGQDPFTSGDVLLVAGVTYTITSTGADGSGFYVQVDGDDIPDSLGPSAPFKVLRQRGISGPTLAKATFLPDIAGLYKFNLTVNNGILTSEPAECIVNVSVSFLPRGIIPDMRFLWDYLSDFWKLVEDRERIETFWSALAQAVSAEMLALWQVDYGKSLRDIQRTFQRRWLHYDLLFKEPPATLELTSVRAVYGGVSSTSIPTAGVPGWAGTHLDLFLPMQAQAVAIYFSQGDTLTAQQVVDRINGYMHAIDARVVARVVPFRDGSAQIVRIDAPFSISVSGTSTCPSFVSVASTIPKGSGGVPIGPRTYLTEKSLAQLDVLEGDLLTVNDTTYRIGRVIDDPSDGLYYQRVSLLDDIDPHAGSNWLISGKATSKSLNFYDALVTAGDVVTVEVVDTATGLIDYITAPATGVSADDASSIGFDTTALGIYLSDPRYSLFFVGVTRRQYTPVDDLVVDVPYLQQDIKNLDDTTTLRRNLDFFIDKYRGINCIRFTVNNDISFDVWEGLVPPDRLWAETTYLDNRLTVESNFGIPAEFTLDDLTRLTENIDYLSAVRGLWYAYFSGPTVFNIRAGAQILLGLPYAEEAGTIIEIRNDFSSAVGRILVQDVANKEITRSYSYPHKLSVETNPVTGNSYAVGDVIQQFAPLVKGVDVLDWVNTPKWFGGLIGQGSFYEVEKFFRFMVRVDSAAFNLSSLMFVKNFILRIKPTYTFPLFVVRETLPTTEVDVTDTVTFKGTLNLYEGPCFHTLNHAQMFDQPRASGGGYWNAFDSSDVTPAYPTPTYPIPWGIDNAILCPEYFVYGKLRIGWLGGNPTVDSIFYFDLPLTTTTFGVFGTGYFTYLGPSGAPYSLGTQPSPATGTIDHVFLEIDGDDGAGGANPITLQLFVNGTPTTIGTFSKSAGGLDVFVFTTAINVNINDVLEVRIFGSAGAEMVVKEVLVVLAQATDWAFDSNLAANTYYVYRSM